MTIIRYDHKLLQGPGLSTHVDAAAYEYPNWAAHTCPVCDCRGFVHGPCSSCGRVPLCYVTTVGPEETEETDSSLPDEFDFLS